MSEEKQGLPVDLTSLPSWAQEAFKAAVAGPEKKVPAPLLQEDVAWPLLLDAAIVSDFLPKDLARGAVEDPQRGIAERTVLSHSELTQGPGGVRWSLRPDVRAAVVSTALNAGSLGEAVQRTQSLFTDPISRALRDCVSGQSATEPDELASLEAQRVAVSWLTGAAGLELPTLAELDRVIEQRRLLAPFIRMIGRVKVKEEGEKPDRFFGRTRELEQLREYVGVVSAGSLATNAQRAVTAVRRAVTGRQPLMISGAGGVGKTTLVSMFMLEHAEQASRSKFPFAYLDFDRSTISARDRTGLLLEMCSQVAVLFEDLAEAMGALNSRVREVAEKIAGSAEGDNGALLRPCLREFRDVIDGYLRAGESRLGSARPFLLVFDTFEIAQYSADDVSQLEEFVRGFSAGDKSLWPRLRLIISGRRRVERFTGEVESLSLGSLDYEGSTAMLMALAADAGAPIERRAAGRLVALIARITNDRQSGVPPLRLRLVGDDFRKRQGHSAKQIVAELMADLQEPLDVSGRGITAAALVDGILVRRVLGHVADSRVKALADPGLVVRRITWEVIHRVMAPGTPDPRLPAPEPGTEDSRPPWSVSEEEARDIFEAFEKEASLVEPDGPNALRHLPDVRREMLPLIRARNRRQFTRVHELAYDYFRAEVKRNPADTTAASEAIYHGMWLERSLDELDPLWPAGVSFAPRIDPDDFEDGSLGNTYLRAKGGQPLALGELRRLPQEIGLEWLDKRASELLAERRIDDAVKAIRTVAGDDYAKLAKRDSTRAVVARLLYRAGFWDEAAFVASRDPSHPGERDQAYISLTRTWATLAAKGPGSQFELRSLIGRVSSIRDPFVSAEVLAHIALGMARNLSLDFGDAPSLHRQLDDIAALVPIDRWTRELRVLRLVILTTTRDHPRYLAAYLEMTDRLPRDLELHRVLGMIFDAVGDQDGRRELEAIVERGRKEKTRARMFEAIDMLWRERKRPVITAILEGAQVWRTAWLLAAWDHADWRWVLGNALSRQLRAEGPQFQVSVVERTLGLAAPKASEDGLTVVQAAADEGRFLELARRLSQSSYSRKDSRFADFGDYPRTAVDIAGALLEWHRTITTGIGPTDSPAQELA